jgi:hypothetical protein
MKNENIKRVLHLTISKLPFEVMYTAEKKIEYRVPSQWILRRLINKKYDLVKFVNGYGNDKPYFIAEYNGWKFESKPKINQYSNGLKVETYIGYIKIYLGDVIEIGNIKND